MDQHHVEILEDDQAMKQQLVRERGRRIKAAAELGVARSSRGRHWGRALVLPKKDPRAVPADEQQAPKKAKPSSSEGRGEEEEEEGAEDGAVEEKVALLRKLVPGGEGMAVEGLLEETTDYIAALKAQVGVMRALACLLSGPGLDAPPEKAVLATPEQ